MNTFFEGEIYLVHYDCRTWHKKLFEEISRKSPGKLENLHVAESNFSKS